MRTHKFFSVFTLSAITLMITVAFVFWGIGPNDSGTAVQFVAQVEDEGITLEQYWRAYDNEQKRLTDQNTSKEDIEKLNLTDRILSRLIDRKVLRVAAEKAGISVSETELQDAIMNTEYFQRNGVFDKGIYERALKLNRLSPSIYEESLKSDLLIGKMSRLIGEATELTAEEMKIIESIEGGNKEQLSRVFRTSKSNQAVKAYIDSMKRMMNITVNKDLIT